jgi:hypothetical protein
MRIGCLYRQISKQCSLVLATVLGYPAPVWVWNWDLRSSPSWYPEHRGTHWDCGRVWTGPQFHFPVPTTLAPMKYFNSDYIATWSIQEMCRLMPYFTSHSQIGDLINIDWVSVKFSRKSHQNDPVSVPTQRVFIHLPIREWEMIEGINLHISRIDYVAIGWELHYLIEARNVDFEEGGLVWKPVATVRFRVGTGPGTKLGIWSRC